MRFWQKTLLVMLTLFILTLDLSVVMIMKKSWQLNMEREVQRASSEQALIANNIYENLNSIKSRGMTISDLVIFDIMSSYADYYKRQGITLQLRDQDNTVYPEESTIPNASMDSRENVKLNEQIVRGVTISNQMPAPYEYLSLTYMRDMEELYARQSELNRYFIYINLIAGPVLITLLYLLIRQLTKPLRLLSNTTKNIADGDYGQRVTLRNNDEFGELAKNFNRMAAAVEQHINELSLMAEEKQRIVDNLAHELRTPLTSMQGFAQYLNAANIGEEERMTASGYIWSETLRLKNLVFKLLDLSVLSHQSIECKPVTVNELFESVRSTEQHQLEQAGIELVMHVEIDWVWGDEDLLASFLVNCIENAIHASNKGSVIRLLAYEENDQAVLEVKDYGKGMSARHVEHVFEPFYRADNARSREHGGAGLGLSLCRQIASAHQAELELESEEHIGTRIRMILQLHNIKLLTS